MVRAISDNNNNDSTTSSRSAFTPAEATRMLPLVKQIVRDILTLSRSIDSQLQQLQVIDALPERMEQSDYREEIVDIRGTLAEDQLRLQSCVTELTSLGVELHDPMDGSVDFPAVMNRRRVSLCWKPEDAQVEFWHEPGQSPKDRKKVDPQKFDVESLN